MIKAPRKIRSHKDLDVWQKAMDFVVDVYAITKEFPEIEKFGLVTQMRRAAISISSNIAEGAGRKGNKEFIQFLYIALGSLVEVETQIEIAYRLSYVSDSDHYNTKIIEIRRMLIGLIKYLKQR